ncbi:MAG: acetate--CoA ligase family protein [Gemmatimonadota bacterium]
MSHELDVLLRPRSVAVIGASRRPNSIGWQILDNLIRHGFTGPVYPINPNADSVHSIPAYASIRDVPGPVDLAVVSIPAPLVLDAARECVESGVKGLVVITAGFREIGGEGAARETALLQLLEGSGVRLVGPNCMGVLNSEAGVRMNATFAPSDPPYGPVAFMSQSGAMGLSVLDYAESFGIGLSMFVSAGNKADVSGNDLLEYWEQVDSVSLVLMYLESFGDPARFVRLGRRITRTKPIFVVKSGRTGAGARAAASHTGALAQTELATDALIAQAGAIRAQTVEELFDLASAFSNQPIPRGKRVAIVTNAGGPGIILADACETYGLDVARLQPETEALLRSRLPSEASVRNPVDMIASATAEDYEHALRCVRADPGVDATIAAFVPPLGIETVDVASAIVRASEVEPDKPVLAVLMGRQGLPAGQAELRAAGIPAYTFPESAARALGALWRYRRILDREEGEQRVFGDVDDDAVRAVLDRTERAGHRKLTEPDALAVAEAYRIPTVPWRYIEAGPSLEERIVVAADEVGYPVALKVVSPDIAHKTDVGGVALDLGNREELEHATRSMRQRVPAAVSEGTGRTPRVDGYLLQGMAPPGRETIVGLTRIPSVGLMAMFGLGGLYVEVMRDVVLRLCPLTDADAAAMLREVKLSALLDHVRGEPPRDRAALVEAVLRLAQLGERHPRIAELDVNPLISLPEGSVAVDVRVQMGD